MGTDHRQHQFDRIVARLRTDGPPPAGRRRPRRVLVTAVVLVGLLWGLLSMAMVAWGAVGVVLACSLVAIIGVGIAMDAYRDRNR